MQLKVVCTPQQQQCRNNCCCPPVVGHYVIIVSSGAVGVGCQRLGLAQRPTKLAQKQALAAIGQVHLMRYYEDILNALGLVRAACVITVLGAVEAVGVVEPCAI
jgi:glutamate 5-kinase